MSRHIQNVFIVVLKGFKLLSMYVKFKSINSSSLSRKKYDGDNFTPVPHERLEGQNTSVRIGLIELTEPSNALN